MRVFDVERSCDTVMFFSNWWIIDRITKWKSLMNRNMRFPTPWYVRPAKAQNSLCICTVWSDILLVARIFYDCWKSYVVAQFLLQVKTSITNTCSRMTWWLKWKNSGNVWVMRNNLQAVNSRKVMQIKLRIKIARRNKKMKCLIKWWALKVWWEPTH